MSFDSQKFLFDESIVNDDKYIYSKENYENMISTSFFCEFFSRNCPDPNPRGPPHCEPRGGVFLPVWIPHYIVVHSGVYTEHENMLKYVNMWIISLFVSCIKSYWMLMFELL